MTTVSVCVTQMGGGEEEEAVLCSFLSFCRNVRREGMTHQTIWEAHGPFPTFAVCGAVCLEKGLTKAEKRFWGVVTECVCMWAHVCVCVRQ